MKTFKIDNNTSVGCIYLNKKNGFAHKAILYVDGKEAATATCSYLNRTWESFEYESVIRDVLEKSKRYTHDQIESMLKTWSKDPNHNGMGVLGTVGMAMAMGNILAGDDKKDQNNWKLRMLKAGIPEGSLNLPNDWDTLPEEEKERRLDGIIKVFQND